MIGFDFGSIRGMILKSSKRIEVLFSILLSAVVLIGCGGGGADGTPAAIGPLSSGGGSSSSSTPSATATVSVSGVVSYERVGQNESTGALNYSRIVSKPVRGATVELLSAGSVIASTQSSATGHYAFVAAPGYSLLSVRVRAELKQISGTAQWDVTVRDNTSADGLYAMQSATFNSGASAIQNLTAGSGWGGASYSNARTAGPFAILDTIYESQQKVLSAQPNTTFPLLKAYWSINNRSDNTGGLTGGGIGTSFFREITSGSATTREIYILGQADVDTDEFDASVIAHEWGHYYQSAFSRDESMGGEHGGGDDRLDRRIAFSEGWGNAWSGIALGRNFYADSSGAAQASGFVLDLAGGYSGTGSKGWFREASVQSVLWNLNQSVGFAPIHETLTGSNFVNGLALSHIHSFAAAFRSVQSGTVSAVLNTQLNAESIFTPTNSFGDSEFNNGGSTLTIPMYRTISVYGSPTVTISGGSPCVTAAFDGSNIGNKLGRYSYITFNASSAGNRTIRVSTLTSGVDVDFEIYGQGGALIGRFDVGVTPSETATVNLAAGNYVMVVYDYNNISATNPCFAIAIVQ